MTPTALRHLLQTQRKKIEELEVAAKEMEARLTKDNAAALKDMESHVTSARLQAETDRERHQHVLSEMRKRCDEDIKVSQAQAKAARDEAKKALEFDRRRAENTVKNSVAAEREEKERLVEELEDVKDKLSREYQSKLRHLEIKVKSAEDQKRIGECEKAWIGEERKANAVLTLLSLRFLGRSSA